MEAVKIFKITKKKLDEHIKVEKSKKTISMRLNKIIVCEGLEDVTINDLVGIMANRKYLKYQSNANELEKPVITIERGGKKANVLGFCSASKVWQDNEANTYYQITVCSEHLDKGIEEIAGTMLHEMVYLYCSMHQIKDTSRSGTYHNKKYKEVAEIHALNVEFDKKIGWSITSLNDESKAFVHTYARGEMFTLVKGVPKKEDIKGTGNPEPSKSSSRKNMYAQNADQL